MRAAGHGTTDTAPRYQAVATGPDYSLGGFNDRGEADGDWQIAIERRLLEHAAAGRRR